MMVPGWSYSSGGLPFVSLANTGALETVLVVIGLLTLALLVLIGAAAFYNRRAPIGRRKRPARSLLSGRHAWAGAHR